MATSIKDKLVEEDDAMAQLIRLRAEVETLMRHRVTPAVAGAAERMASVAQDTVEAVRTQADKFTGRVRGRPFTSIAIAGAVGYVMARLAR
jgi:ElaB/YqjD/DUF883 family membrane-anchored ribosome-binding protein